MSHCLLCSSAIIEDAQYYMTCNIGPEISTVIEQNLEHEIAEDGLICAQCIENVSNIRHDLHTLPPETNVCVYCRSSLFNPDLPIPDGSRVCSSCSAYIQNSLQAQGVISTPPVNTNICVWCQVSLVQRRRHSLPESLERAEIFPRIHPREVGCYAHVMTIVWYLGWAQYQENIAAPALFLDGVLVREDIENEE